MGPVPLLLIDLLIGGVALLVVLVTGFALWRHVKALIAIFRVASKRIDEASSGLDALPAADPFGA